MLPSDSTAEAMTMYLSGSKSVSAQTRPTTNAAPSQSRCEGRGLLALATRPADSRRHEPYCRVLHSVPEVRFVIGLDLHPEVITSSMMSLVSRRRG